MAGRYSLYLRPSGRRTPPTSGGLAEGRPASGAAWLTDGDDLPALLAAAERLFEMPGAREVSVRENGRDGSPFGSVNVMRLERDPGGGATTRTWGDGATASASASASAGDQAARGDGGRHRRDPLADVLPLVARLAGLSTSEVEGWPAEVSAALRAIFQG